MGMSKIIYTKLSYFHIFFCLQSFQLLLMNFSLETMILCWPLYFSHIHSHLQSQLCSKIYPDFDHLPPPMLPSWSKALKPLLWFYNGFSALTLPSLPSLTNRVDWESPSKCVISHHSSVQNNVIAIYLTQSKRQVISLFCKSLTYLIL